MAATRGRPSAELIDEILAAPGSFDLFQAVRLLDDAAVRAADVGHRPPPPELGSQARGAGTGDVIRFRASVSPRFPGASITAARRSPRDEEVVELEIAPFGLFGPTGTLPRHYTTLIVERMARRRGSRDTTLRDFLDIFNHRLAAILVRAWGKYRLAAQLERRVQRRLAASWDEGTTPGRDPINAVLGCVVGLGTAGLVGRLRCGDDAVAYYAGHFAAHPRSVVALEMLLRDALGADVGVESFVGRWLVLDTEDQTRLASREEPRGTHASLGVDTLLGRRSWSIDTMFAVRIGPLGEADYRRWLPSGERLQKLSDLLRMYAGPHLDIVVRPVVRAAETPSTTLGGAAVRDDGAPAGSLLGWTTWLHSNPRAADGADARFPVRS
jgi:type VI secretion system protein ImpH